MIGIDNSSHHRERRIKIIKHGFIFGSSDFNVLAVHEHITTNLNICESRDRGHDIIGASSASAEYLNIQSGSLCHLKGHDSGFEVLQCFLLSLLITLNMLRSEDLRVGNVSIYY